MNRIIFETVIYFENSKYYFDFVELADFYWLLKLKICDVRSVDDIVLTDDLNFQIFWKCIYLTVYVVIISSSWIKYYRPNPSLFVDHFQKWRSNCFDKLVAFDRDA